MISKETKHFNFYAYVNNNGEFLKIMEEASWTKSLAHATLFRSMEEIRSRYIRELIHCGEVRKAEVLVSVTEEREVIKP